MEGGRRRSPMTVADKTDGVCGAANQGPEVGPPSPCARARHLAFNSHPSRGSAASELAQNASEYQSLHIYELRKRFHVCARRNPRKPQQDAIPET